MRTLSKFLTLLLCLELIVSPIAPNLSVLASNEARAEDCPTGFSFDSTLNRCLTKTETANVMNATMSCGSDVNCYKENAQKALQDKVNAGEVSERKKDMGFVSKIAGIAAVAGPVTFAVMGMGKNKSSCKSPAFYGMIAAALAVVVGDNLANLQHKKRLKKIKEDWGKIVNPEDAGGDKDKERSTSIEAQSQAFEMLARAEDSLASAAKMKKNFFMIASLAYGVTAAISGMEIISNKSLKTAAIGANKAAIAATASAAAVVTPPDPAAVAALPKITTASAELAVAAGRHEAYENGQSENPDQAAALKETAAIGDAAAQAKTLAAAKDTKISIKVAAANVKAAAQIGNGSKAAGVLNTATQATDKWVQHTEMTLCEPTGAGSATGSYFNQNEDSLYSYINNPIQLDLKKEIQFLYNLENSKDLASFMINKKEMDGDLVSPIEEYLAFKTEFKQLEEETPDAFEIFKSSTLAVINQLNPISSAFAVEEVQSEASSDLGSPISASSSSSASGNNSASSSTVNSNAAKAFKEEEGKGIDFLSIGIGVGAGVLLGSQKSIGSKLITSKGRLIFSGVMMAMTLMMSKHAGSQAEASTKRAELLRKMKDEFASASGAIYSCKSEDRNDPAKPNCYCYTSENAKNSNRSNSQICQKLWAGINTQAGNYSTLATSSKVCVNQNQQADATCACRASNTCMKVKLNGVSGLGMGSMSVLGGAVAPLNKIMDGTIDGANIDGASLANNAAKVNALNKELAKNPEVAKANNSKGALELKKSLERGAAGLGGSGNFIGGNSGSNMPSNPGEAARMLEKELDQATAPTVGGGDLADFTPAAAPEEALEFGLTGDQLAAQESQIAEVMKEDLDYGGNDINQGSKTNIFEVLSNRYQRSGMRRLFDEKGVTKPEAAAKTDITQ
jgi:hypothetical protein